MEFKNRIQQLRKQKSLSQKQLAEKIGVHFTQVSRYERGDFKPNTDALTRLAKALDTSVDYLMNGTSNEVAKDAGLDKEIISRFKVIQAFDSLSKKTALYLLDAIIAKSQLDNMYKPTSH